MNEDKIDGEFVNCFRENLLCEVFFSFILGVSNSGIRSLLTHNCS